MAGAGLAQPPNRLDVLFGGNETQLGALPVVDSGHYAFNPEGGRG